MSKEEKRKKHNEEVIKKLKAGESLATCSPADTWWPNRPAIKKDKKELAKLYGVNNGDK